MLPSRRASIGTGKACLSIALISLMLTSACSWTAETTITESRSAGGASYPHPPILDETISYRLNPAPLRATTTSPNEPRFLLLAPGSEKRPGHGSRPQYPEDTTTWRHDLQLSGQPRQQPRSAWLWRRKIYDCLCGQP